MTAHLMAIELGPVVQIVAAARKTRDLWFGSYLLSEVAKAAAKSVVNQCDPSVNDARIECLIAPAPQAIADLNEESSFVMGDEILLRVPSEIDPAALAVTARQAAHQRWLDFATDARKRVPASLIEENAWNWQTRQCVERDTCGEVIEVYSAWVPLPDKLSRQEYQDRVTLVKRLLEGRTACRNFPAADGQDAGAPKSSLDGRRRSVLKGPDANAKQPVRNRKLRLNRGEQLDALGVTKRVWGGRKNYPSTARLAADPWIRGASTNERAKFQVLYKECRRLAQKQGGIDPILGSVQTVPYDKAKPEDLPTYPHYHAFPFEGAVLYSTRHKEFLYEAEGNDDAKCADLNGMKSALSKVVQECGEPGAYYAILMADGDNVGAALSQCPDTQRHREFSLRLPRFAESVREIVDQHQGALVYAAGEDIVALLPLDCCIRCADKLRTKFRDDFRDLSVAGKPMTLSVGIAIGHFLDALEDIHQAARDMLDGKAKEYRRTSQRDLTPDKNALAIQYRSRGGAPIECLLGWGQPPDQELKTDPKSQIEGWAKELRSGNLPSKIAFDVRHLAESYKHWPSDSEEGREVRRKAMIADLRRLLSSKLGEARKTIESFVNSVNSPGDVANLANTIIVAGLVAQSQSMSEIQPRSTGGELTQ